ncbi:hypothetical protein Patl1_14769 [Pistacia atlantica]|uniref:Uncharacterized protein n=1 Tax=Pistacia atlantica TaxID=434234 RepID=A0ACC1AY23_9ROSI|nr:hypothetical protein Patl1_14769 [Pistacia atlantica]
MATITKDDQHNHLENDLKDDNEDDEDEDKDDKITQTTAITKDDQQNDPDYDLKDDNEDEDKDDKNSRTSLDALWISASTMNQVPRMLRDMSIAVLRELRGFSLEMTTSTPTTKITPNRTNRMATMMKDDQENDPDYDLKDDNEDDEDEDEEKDDKLPLSQEDVDNFTATLLLRGNRQFIDHRLHRRTAEIRKESRAFISVSITNQVPRMLRDMFIAVLRELRGFSLEMTTSTPTTKITPNRTNRMATMMKDDQENDPDYDHERDNEGDEDEAKRKMTSNSRTSLDALVIRLIDRVNGFVVNKKMQTSHSL